MASLPSSHRQRTSFLPTPLVGDVLFTERVVCQTKAVPAYGTAHPNTARWPDHKLVFAKERDEPGSVDTFDFYYAADRATQDAYNFSFTKADIGGTKFDAVARTYVTLRSAFTPNTPAMGATMPDTPASLFSGTYVLAEKRQQRIGEQELDSLYVAETHVYVKRATLSAVKMNDETGRVKRSVTNLYYRGETVSGTTVETLAASPTNAYWGQQTDGVFRELDQLSENWFAIIESNVIPDGSTNSSANPAKTCIVNRVTPLGTDIYFTEVGAMPATIPDYGSAHYDSTNWPNHKLSLISPADASGLLFTFHYVADRSSQDNYNFTSSQADIGGQKFDTIQRSYLVPRATFVEETIAMGSTMPDVPSIAFGTGYVLASEVQRRVGDPQFDNLYVTIERTYVRKVTLGDIGFDEKTGRSTSSTVTLRYSGEVTSGTDTIDVLFADKDNAYWGLQTSGVFRTVEQLSEKWFAVTERSVLPESSINATGNPAKTRIVNRVTPLGTDIYFTEVGAMPGTVPAYGSAHYDATNWPNHKLSLISPADASGLLFTFHYVADRSSQDDYNFELLGGEQLVRTYVVKRDLYFARPVGHASAVEGEFLYPPAGIATPDIRFTDYCFADDTQRRYEKEFDSVYVVIQRRFIRPITISFAYDEQFQRQVRITKEVIPKTDEAPIPSSAGSVTEIQDGNNYHSVRITKEIVLVDSEVYPYQLPNLPATKDYGFPPKLESVALRRAFAFAEAEGHRASYSEDYFFQPRVTDPRPGPYSATVLRFITDDPESIKAANPITFIPQPIRETVAIVGWWWYASEEHGNATMATAKEWQVPPTIHGEIIITDGESNSEGQVAPPARGNFKSTIAATPGVEAFLNLTEAVIDYKVTEMPFGLYLVSVIKIDCSNLYE
jgi:hypothetical protein